MKHQKGKKKPKRALFNQLRTTTQFKLGLPCWSAGQSSSGVVTFCNLREEVLQ